MSTGSALSVSQSTAAHTRGLDDRRLRFPFRRRPLLVSPGSRLKEILESVKLVHSLSFSSLLTAT
jgi:hypothetical protein